MQIYSKSMKNATSPLFRNHNRSALPAGTYITHCVIYYPLVTSLTRNLKNPWVDFHETWYRGAPPGVDELIRFGRDPPNEKVKAQ